MTVHYSRYYLLESYSLSNNRKQYLNHLDDSSDSSIPTIAFLLNPNNSSQGWASVGSIFQNLVLFYSFYRILETKKRTKTIERLTMKKLKFFSFWQWMQLFLIQSCLMKPESSVILYYRTYVECHSFMCTISEVMRVNSSWISNI